MDLTGMRSLFTCRSRNEAVLCCREELCVEDVSACESPPREHRASRSVLSVSHPIFFFKYIYMRFMFAYVFG